MSRKLVVALFAALFAVVTAWADPGGEGGCVNLPGGRGGGRPGMSSYNGPFHATVVEANGVTLRLPAEFFDAAALVDRRLPVLPRQLVGPRGTDATACGERLAVRRRVPPKTTGATQRR